MIGKNKENNKKLSFFDNSMALTVIYTIGDFVIAMVCNYLITGASLDLVALDALIEPMVNGVWFYAIQKLILFHQSLKS